MPDTNQLRKSLRFTKVITALNGLALAYVVYRTAVMGGGRQPLAAAVVLAAIAAALVGGVLHVRRLQRQLGDS